MLLLALMFNKSQSTANMYFGHQNSRYDCKTSEITSFESLNLLIRVFQQKNKGLSIYIITKTYRSLGEKKKLTI